MASKKKINTFIDYDKKKMTVTIFIMPQRVSALIIMRNVS